MHFKFTRFVAGAVVALSIFGGAGMAQASALTSSQISAIVGLLQSFGADQSVINNVSASLGGNQNQTVEQVKASSSCITFVSLKRGDTDAKTSGNVSKLQKYLGIGPTGFFGPITQAGWNKNCADAVISIPVAPSSTNGIPTTYSNTLYGFSFQYPPDFSVAATSLLNRVKVTATGQQPYGSTLPAPQVLVEASIDPSTVSTCNTVDLGSLASIGSASLISLGVNVTPTLGTQTINGVQFHSASVAADLKGVFVSFTLYAALNNGVCYVLGTAIAGKDPSTQNQSQSASPVVLPAVAANIAAEENAMIQSLHFSNPTASVQSSPSSAATSLQDAVRKSNLIAIQVNLELYYGQFGKYPNVLTAMQNNAITTSSLYDPATYQPYNYKSSVAGDSYTLCATLSSGLPYCVQNTSSNSTSTAIGNPSVSLITPSSGQSIAIGSTYQITWQASGAIPSSAFLELSLVGSDGKTYGIPSQPLAPSQGSYSWQVVGPVCVPDKNYPGQQTCSATLNPGQYQLIAQMYSTVVNGQPSGVISQAMSPWVTLTGNASNNIDPLKG